MIVLVEDLDVIAWQTGIVGDERSLTDILREEYNKGFPQWRIKFKVLDGLFFLFNPFFHALDLNIVVVSCPY
jgi:hypothetical protein